MNSKSNTVLWIIGAVLVVLGGAYFLLRGDQVAVPNTDADASGPVRIGVITPLSGDNSNYGQNMQRAYDLAAEQINSAGGVNNRMVELVYEDGKCNGTDAATAAEALKSAGVSVILGGTCSGETLSAAEITQAARILLISPSATSPDITDAGDLVYRTYPSDSFEGSMMANYATGELEAKKAAVISENTDFAQGVRGVFTEKFQEMGGEVVYDETFNTGEVDFRTLVTKLGAAEPDVIYLIPQATSAGELILKQLQDQGIEAPVVATNTMLDRAAISETPDLYEGVVMAEVSIEGNQLAQEMLDAYKVKYGVDPEFTAFTAAAYDSVRLVVEAIDQTNSTDAEQLADYFNAKVNDWPGAIGTFNFDDNGDAEIDLQLVRVKEGSVETLK